MYLSCLRADRRVRLAATLLVAALAGFTPACGSQDSAADGAPPTGLPGPEATLLFEQQSTLKLTPGEVAAVRVETSPPAAYELSFLLLGDSLDASLDKTTVVADADGAASVFLQAPSKATTFRLRSTIKEGPSAELSVSVSAEGFGTIVAVPVYGGVREVETWEAAVVTHTSCNDLVDDLPEVPVGALKSQAPGDSAPSVDAVPVGPTVAVVLRAGSYIWGCADESTLRAGETLEVPVTVFDKPVDLTTTDLDVSLDFRLSTAAREQMLVDAADKLATTAFPPMEGQETVLLDALSDAIASPADQAAFETARVGMSLDATIGSYLTAIPVDLTQLLKDWAYEGALAAPTELRARLRSYADQGYDPVNGYAQLEALTFAGVPAAKAGVPSIHLVSWSAQTGDIVLLGGQLFWLPTRYVGATALNPAQTAVPSATNVVEALDQIISCADVASNVGSFGSCDLSCVEQACVDALALRWEQGLDASAANQSPGTLSLAVTAQAKVNEDAQPASFDGAWAGQLTTSTLSTNIDGTATGIPYEEPAL